MANPPNADESPNDNEAPPKFLGNGRFGMMQGALP